MRLGDTRGDIRVISCDPTAGLNRCITRDCRSRECHLTNCGCEPVRAPRSMTRLAELFDYVGLVDSSTIGHGSPTPHSSRAVAMMASRSRSSPW